MGDQNLPNKAQGIISSCLLLWLTFITAPLSAFALVLALVTGKSKKGSKDCKDEHGPVALVNGGRMQKALFVARALARQGYRVVLVEERGWGELCAVRFSNSISRFRLIPAGGGKDYVNAIVRVAMEEKVSLFVPCSGAGTTVEDAQAAAILRQVTKGKIRAIIQDPHLASTLHEKDTFMDLARYLDLDTPSSSLVNTPEEAMDLLKKPGQPSVLLKAVNVLDDIGRSDMTIYPIQSPDGHPDWSRTEQRIRHGLHIPLCEETPYVAQEFVGGSGATEWCTHCTVVDGEIRAFVCCPSNDMLMTYWDSTRSSVGQRALQWTKDFVARLQEKRIVRDSPCGEFSFDFIHQPATGRLVVLECNPRVHTAFGLLAHRPDLGSVFEPRGPNSRAGEQIFFPDGIGKSLRPMSWLGHYIPARIAPSFLPDSIRLAIHPLWIKQEGGKGVKKGALQDHDLHAVGVDAAWDWDDPLPFFALYHIQWPYLLLRQLFVRRKAWSRINVSTARIFEV